MLTLLIVVILALIGYILPKKYDEYFYHKYHEKVVSMPLAIATAVSVTLWLLLLDFDGFWFWASLIVAILLCIASMLCVAYTAWQVRAGTLEIILVVLSQLFATAGVLILIIGVIAMIMKMLGGNKKRR